MPHQTEPSANNAMGTLLQGMLSRRQVLSENTQTTAGHPRAASGHPDYGGRSLIEEFRDKKLKPAYLADADPNRALLDGRVVCDLLEFDEDTYVGVRRLAAKWCAQPSVHGGKSRPRGAGLVV